MVGSFTLSAAVVYCKSPLPSVSRRLPVMPMGFSLLILSSLFGSAAGVFPADRPDYLKDVKPVLTARCYACHGALRQKGDLRVDTAKSLIDAGVVVPGNSGTSPLMQHVLGSEGASRMPPPSEGEGLSRGQIACDPELDRCRGTATGCGKRAIPTRASTGRSGHPYVSSLPRPIRGLQFITLSMPFLPTAGTNKASRPKKRPTNACCCGVSRSTSSACLRPRRN